MPTKITNSVSNPSEGLISVSDVQKIINDYINVVEVSSNDPSRQIQKRYSFDINIDAINCLFEKAAGEKSSDIRINLILNSPGQIDCNGENNVGDFLSALICCVSTDGQNLLGNGNAVLVEGFKSHPDFICEDKIKGLGKSTGNKDCCVQGNPKGRS